MILQDTMSVLSVFHLIREHLIDLVLDLDQDRCAKNLILFALLIKKLVSMLANYCECLNCYIAFVIVEMLLLQSYIERNIILCFSLIGVCITKTEVYYSNPF